MAFETCVQMEALRLFGRSETRCRLYWVLALLFLSTYSGHSQAGGIIDYLTLSPDLNIDECHEEFTEASANASLAYSDAFEICELNANETTINLEVDVELERLQIELGSSAVCGNLRICDTLDDDLQYFQCISENGSRNLEILTEINYNATSAYTRLREDYDALHRTFLLCSLEAQKNYMEALKKAHNELTECRLEIDEFIE
ncbi:uncharacterized protein [Drosophila bipectinata]|uniref:uncharacterized protein n=1 Tax=Drosophila bipectinata TaxID=42026 RepID=UPI001C89CC6B|nr:uncharacterized protein LOC108123582 [Drosophila bipectinata]